MPDNPYSWYGTDIPRMLGRATLFERISRYLAQNTPPHLSVIAPRCYGKTVLLHHLAEHFSQGRDRYRTSIFWDIRHDTPTSDTLLRRRFAELIKRALQSVGSEAAEYIELENDETLSDGIESVLDELAHEQATILAVLDGFDAMPLGTSITHNILGQMRAWAQYTSLRFVIGSRATLQDLCKSQATADSDFWRIFLDPVQMGQFEEDDWSGLLAPFDERGIRLDSSARKELIHQTGGVPILTSAMLRGLFEQVLNNSTLTGDMINQFADQEQASFKQLLKDLWDDCDIDMQTILTTIQKRPMPKSEISPQRFETLIQRGLVREARDGLRSACRLMDRHVRQEGAAVTDLRRLFGDSDRYTENVQGLLELRLSHLQGIDTQLCSRVERAIRDLHPHPENSLSWVRNIVSRALELIWDAELPPDRTLPEAWVNEWKHNGDLRGTGDINTDISNRILPNKISGQCRVLNLMTGTSNTPRMSRYLTKSTYLLVDYLQSVGDFGQHLDGGRVDTGFAASVCLSAIELCESWVRDRASG